MYNLGDILKETRQQKQLSQFKTAKDICSQSTLSEIEHNKYIPNPQLLINLCERLSIVFEDISLANNFKICKDNYFNQKINSFYKAHNYDQLQAFLNRPTVIETVQTSKQTQAYYFYLAICALNLEKRFDKAKEFLKLSLANTGHSRKQTTLTRVGNVLLAYVYAQQGLKNSALRQIDLSLKDLNLIQHEDNLNLIFYVSALSYFKLSKLDLAIQTIENGVNFICKNKSHFMLLNSFCLMAQIIESGREKNTVITIQNYDLFKTLFHAPAYQSVTS